MSKKRSQSSERRLRRELEILRAQVKTAKSPTIQIQTEKRESAKEDKSVLPIAQIKSDLLKTAIFAAGAVVLLTAMSLANVSYTTILKLIKF